MSPRASAATDPGRRRDVNEDRVYVDEAHGLFIVVDGIGGQAAGGRAADIAVQRLRAELEQGTTPSAERVRQAITLANNEIYRAATARPEWSGMACVLTVMVANSERAIVGHVGDTRLYRITAQGVQKLTHDHSPIGEREDAGEISELDAMHHPRRNEVYRDVGSETHAPNDPEFIDIHEIALDRADAYLLCSDGLSDVLDAEAIHRVVIERAGDPARVSRALVDAANAAGGKDNIAVAYVEGDRFGSQIAERGRHSDTTRRKAETADTQTLPRADVESDSRVRGGSRSSPWRRALTTTALAVTLVLAGASFARLAPGWFDLWRDPIEPTETPVSRLTVKAGESINEALRQAAPGSIVVVEPGEYRERVALISHVRLVSEPPRQATIRLPGSTVESDAAIVATDVTDAELRGFRIIGDATDPMGTGILIARASVAVVDVDITGATRAAIDVSTLGSLNLVGATLHDNPGAALVLRPSSSARVTQNTFTKNGGSELVASPFVVDPGAVLEFTANTLSGVAPSVFAPLDDRAASIERDNWFLGLAPQRGARPAQSAPRGRQ